MAEGLVRSAPFTTHTPNVRLSLALWTIMLVVVDLVVLVALPGWDTKGDVSGRDLWMVFNVLLGAAWVIGVVALLLGRRLQRIAQRWRA